MATQPDLPSAEQSLWQHVRAMRLANILLVLGLISLAMAWFSPRLLNPPHSDGKPCEIAPGKSADATDGKFRIVTIQPVDFRRQDAICVTVENVVSKSEAGRIKDDEIVARGKLAEAQASQDAAEDDSFKASKDDLPVAKQKADVMAARRVAAQKALDDVVAARTKATVKHHYTLYLNGKESPFTADADPIPGQQMLVFRLEESDDASSELGKFWRNAITRPIVNGRLDAHLALSDGTGSVVPYVASDTANKEVVNRVIMYSVVVRALSSVALLALLAWLIVLAIRTPLLRAGNTMATSYSLARVQMMFWLVLVSGGYLYIWFVVGQWLNVMNSATFALLGISGAATGAALTIDANRGQPGAPAPAPPATTKNFFRDIASDGNGNVQLQRIQMVLWTLILGVIFVWNVAIKLELPAFDANLLALAGIVNGVYVALKTQES